MSKSRRRRRRSSALQKIILVVVILVIVILIAFFFVIRPMKQRLASSVAEKVIEMQVSSDTDSDVTAEEILDVMSEEDQKTIEEICEEYLDVQTLTEISGYLAQGDTASVKAYVKESLSEEELAQIQEIYEKYQDELSEYLE
ncbi:MAG: hypothetical protein LIO39_04505 [Lachnospiraceae bacterium]|nr:hypothetical protein [Lachnospiraceae bacterium]